MQRRFRRNSKIDLVAGFELEAGARRLPVNTYNAFGNQLLRVGAGKLRALFSEEFIEARSGNIRGQVIALVHRLILSRSARKMRQ